MLAAERQPSLDVEAPAAGPERPSTRDPRAERLLTLQRALGNRAIGRLLRRAPNSAQALVAARPPGAARLARQGPHPEPSGGGAPGPAPGPDAAAGLPAPARAAVQSARESNWPTARRRMLALSMGALLDACSVLENEGRLTVLSANIAHISPAASARLWSAVLAVQDGSAEERMRYRLALPRADTDALDRWDQAHPSPLPVAAPVPPTRSDGASFTPSAPDLSDTAWLRELLRFFGLAPATGSGAATDACVYNGRASTVDDVLGDVALELLFAGRTVSGDVARAIVLNRLTAAQATQRIVAQSAGDPGAVDWPGVLRTLDRMPAADLLESLDALRGAGRLDAVAHQIDRVGSIGQARMWAAVLAVQQHIGAHFTRVFASLAEPDRGAITDWSIAHPLREIPAPLGSRYHGGQPFQPSQPDISDSAWVGEFLDYFGFGPPMFGGGRLCMFNGASADLTEVVDIVQDEAERAGRHVDFATTYPLVAAARAATFGPHLFLTFALAGTHHTGLDQRGQSWDPQTEQFSLTLTFQGHPDLQAGPEHTIVAQLSAFTDDAGRQAYRPQSLVGGIQEAWVMPFLNNLLQIAVFAQLLGGLAMRQHTVPTTIALNRDPTFRVTDDVQAQAAVGFQVGFNIPGTDGHLMLGVQGAAQGTVTGGARDIPAATFDLTGNVFLQIKAF